MLQEGRTRRVFWVVLGTVACLFLGFLVQRFLDTEGQVRRAQEEWAEAIEGREWEDLDGLLSPEYSDRWGLGAGDLQQVLGWVRSHFLLMDIEYGVPGEVVIDRGGERPVAEVGHVVRLAGRGSPVAQEVLLRANGLSEPFVFRWEKTGVGPGSWRLLSVGHEELRVSPAQIRRVLELRENY